MEVVATTALAASAPSRNGETPCCTVLPAAPAFQPTERIVMYIFLTVQFVARLSQPKLNIKETFDVCVRACVCSSRLKSQWTGGSRQHLPDARGPGTQGAAGGAPAGAWAEVAAAAEAAAAAAPAASSSAARIRETTEFTVS